VAADGLQFKMATTIVGEAISLALRASNYRSLSKILVDLGSYLYLDHQYSDSIAILQQAISGLSKDDSLHQCGAHISLGAAYLELDKHSLALESFQRAEQYTTEDQHYSRACILNYIAVAQTATGDLGSAVTTYRKSVALSAASNPLLHAYASVDLMALLVRLGQLAEVQEVASQGAFTLSPISGQTPLVAKILAITMRIATRSQRLGPEILRELTEQLAAICKAQQIDRT
jgi:tetratricopeptide (TPR) repeat protein